MLQVHDSWCGGILCCFASWCGVWCPFRFRFGRGDVGGGGSSGWSLTLSFAPGVPGSSVSLGIGLLARRSHLDLGVLHRCLFYR